jgi:hypothetical protein
MKLSTCIITVLCAHSAMVFSQELFSPSTNTPTLVELVQPFLPNRDLTINKDWTEAYFTVQGHNRSFSAIVQVKKIKGKWSAPSVASFSGKYNDLEPALSPDGKRLYFASNRPVPGGPDKKDMDIWYVERTVDGWSEPINPGAPLNTSGNEFYPSVALDGSVYFTAQYDKARGADIFCGRFVDGKFLTPVALGAGINEATFEINPFISPDERFLIFSAYGRAGGLGSADLYISFKDAEGNWKPAIHLDKPINSQFIDYCPFVSQDEKSLFFTSARVNVDSQKQYTFEELTTLLGQSENGLENVYSISFDAIKSLDNQK